MAAPDEDSGLPGWGVPVGVGVVLLLVAGAGLWLLVGAGPADSVP